MLALLVGCGSESTEPEAPSSTNRTPVVDITSPPDGLTAPAGLNYLTFAATATDVEDGPLTDSIQWSSSLDGAMGSGASVAPFLSVGVHTVTSSVEDSEGLSGADQVTVTIQANIAPHVSIDYPTDGSSLRSGPVPLRAQATDPEFGDLSPFLQWSSSVDGAIGFGSGGMAHLSPGTHTITASAEDAGGKTGAAAVTVEVGESLKRDTIRISSTHSHTCAVNGSDKAHCWGLNDDGQIGNNTTSQASSPSPVATVELFWRALSTGDAFSCGITVVYGRTYCWGGNTQRQLGDGSTTPSSVPRVVPAEFGFATLSSGSAHTCALLYSGLAYCWGTNVHGEIGNGDRPTAAGEPTPVAGGHAFTDIAAGGSATCAISVEGPTWCWGSDGGGGLGVGTSANGAIEEPVMLDGAPAFVKLAAGERHMCGVTAEGTAYCWGENQDGQVGNGGTEALVTTPTTVVGGLSFKEIYAGARHSCGLVDTGAAYCWGTNLLGELGIGTNAPMASSPQPVAGGLSFEVLAAGWRNTCGIATVGDVAYCWGDAYAGALGDGGTTSPVAYAPVATDPF